MVGPQDRIDSFHLAKATSVINQKIRSLGVSSSEILFRREQSSAKPLETSDESVQKHNLQQAIINKQNHESGYMPSKSKVKTGDVVFLKDNPKKHERRSPYIVSDMKDQMATVKKVFNLQNEKPCRVSKSGHVVHQERLFPSGKLPNQLKNQSPMDILQTSEYDY